MKSEIDYFINAFADRVNSKKACIFVGAGLSSECGYKTWKQLIEPLARKLKIDPTSANGDLRVLAQHIVNQHSESLLMDHLVREFTRKISPSESHELIARLPISNIWTTNYDRLIEYALSAEDKKMDLIIGNDGWHKATQCDVTLFKMHGTIDDSGAREVVLTLKSYEEYVDKYPMMYTELYRQLVRNSFLFIGCSFDDFNLNMAIAKARLQVGTPISPHFIILRKNRKNKNKEKLFANELRRRDVHPIFIDSFSDIPGLLRKIESSVCQKRVFISGSYKTDRFHEFCYELGHKLAEHGYTVVSAFGENVAGKVAEGAVDGILEKQADFVESSRLWPWTLVELDLSKDPKRFDLRRNFIRSKMLRSCASCIIIGGGKTTFEEYEEARNLGCFTIPIPFTGGAARKVTKELLNTLDVDSLLHPDKTTLKQLNGFKKKQIHILAEKIVTLIDRRFYVL